ncbi:hypothetical protein [Actinokineospora bangkokensis]|uniref:Uncharacterized protein n=1 Tax=Actinokineospora bangkokensis TaxID=1193682 RepID=A0A1Q9LEU3_9PSEU|nr:hypothetical protein [Actinokineospora bangkokensis]OLR90557.1 hypothetical protein BJP25_28450 [Actinokineospora bangkokensis]
MDRPNTGTPGKRRPRTGAVRVGELIGGRWPAPRRPADPALPALPRPRVDDRATVQFERITDEPMARETTTDDPAATAPRADERPTPASRTSALAQLAGLGLAAAALCGAVATSAVVSSQRAAAPTEAPPSLQITGERALLPDLLVAAYGDSGRRGDLLPAATTTPAAQARTPRVSSADPVRAGATARPVLAPRELVREYYRLVRTDPVGAYDLLAPDLRGADRAAFADACAERDLRLESVQEHGAGGDQVVAVVRLTLDDGSPLLVRQLLTVGGEVPQLITRAEVLGAQAQ